jgi:uncharacterized protein YjiS (DUF1127 family)
MSTTLTSKCTLAGAVRDPGPRRTAAVWPIATALAELLSVWLDRARQRRQLHALDDRMLRDIGLTRADIEFEAHKHFWRR